MSMEADLRALLVSAIAGVSPALVPAGSILWDARNGVPSIRLALINSADGLTYAGGDELTEAMVQIDCFASTPDAAHDIAQAVRSELHGLRADNFRLVKVEGVSGAPPELETAAPATDTPAAIARRIVMVRVFHATP
jgi:hypothetical protein